MDYLNKKNTEKYNSNYNRYPYTRVQIEQMLEFCHNC